MRVALLSREYPPEVYGGAGIHVAYLARELARCTNLEIHCFGGERPAEEDRAVITYRPCSGLAGQAPYLAALQAMSVDVAMAGSLSEVDVVHSHTWYTNFAGHLAKLVYGTPHVVTVHSLEPLRPWKADQLGSGYELSSFCERVGLESADAVIAVSTPVAADVCRCYPEIDPELVTVIHNAVDPDEFKPDPRTDVLERYGIEPDRAIAVCVARITQQKGLGYLLDATRWLDPSVQLVLRAGPADSPALAQELRARIAEVATRGRRIVWIEDQLNRRQLAQLLGHAAVVCCPSIYEPFGLVAIEAMACQTPVVASAVGGIPEVVDDGETGFLVPFEPVSEEVSDPAQPERFSRDLAAAINILVHDRDLGRKMGEAGRHRVIETFSWSAAARRTVAVYETVLGAKANGHPVPLNARRAEARSGGYLALPNIRENPPQHRCGCSTIAANPHADASVT